VTASDCELCAASRFTPWFHEDETCWIAECESCAVPLVVWREHGVEPPPAEVAHMLGELERVAATQFGDGQYWIDRLMRQIPDHFHAHARRKW
jgi:hypothetical protein